MQKYFQLDHNEIYVLSHVPGLLRDYLFLRKSIKSDGTLI